MPVGVVVQRRAGGGRWQNWQWKPVALLPGAGPADWRVLREEGTTTEFHAGTRELELHRTETEAYRVALANDPPSAYVVLAPDDDPDSDREYQLKAVTASPFEAQDCLDSGEELVEPVPMPPGLIAWIREFVDRHHVDEPFRKRKRREVDTSRTEDGKGDPRIRQLADVYRAPGNRRDCS